MQKTWGSRSEHITGLLASEGQRNSFLSIARISDTFDIYNKQTTLLLDRIKYVKFVLQEKGNTWIRHWKVMIRSWMMKNWTTKCQNPRIQNDHPSPPTQRETSNVPWEKMKNWLELYNLDLLLKVNFRSSFLRPYVCKDIDWKWFGSYADLLSVSKCGTSGKSEESVVCRPRSIHPRFETRGSSH